MKMICEGCGVEFEARNQRQGSVLCIRCIRRKAKRRRSLADKSRREERQIRDGKGQELTAVAVAARNAGMTYGKYVATMGVGW